MEVQLNNGVTMPSPGFGAGAIRGWQADNDDVAEVVAEAIRVGIRSPLRERLSNLPLESPGGIQAAKKLFVAQMDRGPIALVPDKANEQHYEVPAAFFAQVLGPKRKYSS